MLKLWMHHVCTVVDDAAQLAVNSIVVCVFVCVYVYVYVYSYMYVYMYMFAYIRVCIYRRDMALFCFNGVSLFRFLFNGAKTGYFGVKKEGGLSTFVLFWFGLA